MPQKTSSIKFNSLNNPVSQQGFTLVEVLTVMLVLVAIASITVEMSSDFVFQQRYEVTKDRYAKIKKAIIGDPNQVINGMPNIEGFVKDVGRLPFKLEELTNGYCSANTSTNFYSDSTACSAVSGTWNTKVYLSASDLRDGWGNDSTDGNYGWSVTFPSTTSMNIQSKGKNGCIDGVSGCTDTETYDEDYPDLSTRASIEQSDWMVNINGIKTNIMASSINGSCTISVQPTDQATCELAGRTWGYCSNVSYTTEAACTGAGETWIDGCSGTETPASKLGCESVGGNWNGTLSNICMKINGSIESNVEQITENGREKLTTFNFASPSVTFGETLIGIYQHNGASCTNLTYPSLCVDTNNDATNFTKANCETNSGTWKDDGSEKYCYRLTAGGCTGTLNGTLSPNKEETTVTIIPNTTLPTINW